MLNRLRPTQYPMYTKIGSIKSAAKYAKAFPEGIKPENAICQIRYTKSGVPLIKQPFIKNSVSPRIIGISTRKKSGAISQTTMKISGKIV